MSIHYLDWAASAPPFSDILERAASLAVSRYGNPSSLHSAGKDARSLLEEARATLAGAIGAQPGQIVFTSGGTEADSIALLSVLPAKNRGSIVISAIEHSAVFEQARLLEGLGFDVVRVAPDRYGVVQADSVAGAVRKDTVLVAIMALNNETGAIQPVRHIAEAIRALSGPGGRPPFFHCDAVQAPGSTGFDAAAMGVDSAAFSAHKLGGPRGVGALYLRRPLRPFLVGGGQEGGMRPGTHNTPGAWAFAEAASRTHQDSALRLERSRVLEQQLLDGIRSIGGACPLPPERLPGDGRYSPHIVCASFPGLGGETMQRLLDDAGIAVSTGAACSGAKKERRVLDAMGIDRKLSFSSIRISTGRDTKEEDIAAFLERAADAYRRYKT